MKSSIGSKKTSPRPENVPLWFNINLEQIVGYLARERKILLQGEITEESIAGVVKMLIQLDFDSNEPITLLISSRGGDFDSGYFLQDTISMLNSPVDGLVLDYAGSMAVDVLQMCRNRMAMPHSRIYCHFLRHGFKVIGDIDDVHEEDILAFRRQILERKKVREKLYAERMKCSVGKVQKIFRAGEMHNINMSSSEALRAGLIDKIPTDVKLFPNKYKKR
jgi:ATP-dependent Clp protease protease subunit